MREDLDRASRELAIARITARQYAVIRTDQLGPYRVDFLWRDRGLIVETDGFEHHETRTAFEGDRARAVELRLFGFETQRFSHRQVRDPDGLAASLKALFEAIA